MVSFILNDTLVESGEPEGTVLLDIIRYKQHLPGTKIGCREGDCGACTVLVGELRGDQVEYRSMTSCLLALANVQGFLFSNPAMFGLPSSARAVWTNAGAFVNAQSDDFLSFNAPPLTRMGVRMTNFAAFGAATKLAISVVRMSPA